jgi:hypothetical protein
VGVNNFNIDYSGERTMVEHMLIDHCKGKKRPTG